MRITNTKLDIYTLQIWTWMHSRLVDVYMDISIHTVCIGLNIYTIHMHIWLHTAYMYTSYTLCFPWKGSLFVMFPLKGILFVGLIVTPIGIDIVDKLLFWEHGTNPLFKVIYLVCFGGLLIFASFSVTTIVWESWSCSIPSYFRKKELN